MSGTQATYMLENAIGRSRIVKIHQQGVELLLFDAGDGGFKITGAV
jgi:hypothetical protein